MALDAPPVWQRRWLVALVVVAMMLVLVPLEPAPVRGDTGGAISGTVVDADGAPAAGSCVEAFERRADGIVFAGQDNTDAEGEYRVEVGEGFFEVQAYVNSDCTGSPFPYTGGSDFVTLVDLSSGGEVSGIDLTLSLDDSGDFDDPGLGSLDVTLQVPVDFPATSVCITPIAAEDGFGLVDRVLELEEVDLPGEVSIDIGPLATDSEYLILASDCEFDTPTTKFVSLYADGQDGSSTTSLAEATPVAVGSGITFDLLASDVELEVELLDEGQPIGADVAVCWSLSGPTGFSFRNSSGPRIETAWVAGEFRLEVGPCAFDLDNPYLEVERNITLNAGEVTTLQIELEQGVPIIGTVTGSDNQPVLGAQLQAVPGFNFTFSEDTGEYAFPPLPADTYEVTASPTNIGTPADLDAGVSATVEVPAGPAEPVEVDFQFEPGAGVQWDADRGLCLGTDGPSIGASALFRLHTGVAVAVGLPAGTYASLAVGCGTPVVFEDVELTAGEVLDLEEKTPVEVDPGAPAPGISVGDLQADPSSIALDQLESAAGTVTVTSNEVDLSDPDRISVLSPTWRDAGWTVTPVDAGEAQLTVPQDAAAGRYFIEVFDDSANRFASTTFEVLDPRVSLSRSRAVADTALELDATITGFERPFAGELSVTLSPEDGGDTVTPDNVERLWGDLFRIRIGDGLDAGTYDVTATVGSAEASARLLVVDSDDAAGAPLVEVEGPRVSTDPQTGEVLVQQVAFDPEDVEVTRDLSACDDITSANIRFGGELYEMAPTTADTDLWSATIPAEAIERNRGGGFDLVVACAADADQNRDEPVGTIELFDPSGDITDAVTGDPVVGAEVTLFNVPGWTPQQTLADVDQPDTCQSNLTKPGPAGWNQPAPTELGVIIPADQDPPLSDPAEPVQLTDDTGRYAWDVAAGCWYVTVSADGYADVTSSVVGVDEVVGEVIDLDLALTPLTEQEPAPGTTPAPGTPGVPGERPSPERPSAGPQWVSCEDADAASFPDVRDGSVHADAVGCLAALELLRGFEDGSFGPARSMTRGQFASILVDALEASGLELPSPATSRFEDTGGVHGDAIERLAAAGIVQGVSDTRFNTSGSVTRGQQLSMLAAAGDAAGVPLPTGGTPFPDTVGSTHEEAITAARAAGIAEGRPDGTFAAGADVRRDQAASLFARWLAFNAEVNDVR